MTVVPIVEMPLGGRRRLVAVCENSHRPEDPRARPPLTVRGQAARMLLRQLSRHGIVDVAHDGRGKLMTGLREAEERNRELGQPPRDIAISVAHGATDEAVKELLAKGARPWVGSRRTITVYEIVHRGRRLTIAPFFGLRRNGFTRLPRADRQLLWRLAVTAAARDQELEVLPADWETCVAAYVGEIVEQADDGAILALACIHLHVRDAVEDAVMNRAGGWAFREIETNLPPPLSKGFRPEEEGEIKPCRCWECQRRKRRAANMDAVHA